ncbi:MAG: glycosyltransferase [Candidatus Binataceae bacterium]
MIFVTVGNFMAFPRLVNAVDRLKAAGIIPEDVLLQVGGAENFESRVCQVVRFLSPAEFEKALREASVVISHAGCGTLIQALAAEKVPVVMPRRKHYGEHVDDHQIELAQTLAADGRLILAERVDELSAAIEQARSCGAPSVANPPRRMFDLVSQAIEELLADRN